MSYRMVPHRRVLGFFLLGLLLFTAIAWQPGRVSAAPAPGKQGEAQPLFQKGAEKPPLALLAGRDYICPQHKAIEIEAQGTLIIGDIHSNESVRVGYGGSSVLGRISVVQRCINCDQNEVLYSSVHPVTYPSFEAYEALAVEEGLHYIGNVRLNDGQQFGTPKLPIAYIHGDLEIRGDDVQLTGLIFVNGNVMIHGDRATGAMTIISTGEIEISHNSHNLRVFEDGTGQWPLLAPGKNMALFYSNVGWDGSCSPPPAIDIQASQSYLHGALLAPSGVVMVGGFENRVEGSVVGNSIEVYGAHNTIVQDAAYFPPQKSSPFDPCENLDNWCTK